MEMPDAEFISGDGRAAVEVLRTHDWSRDPATVATFNGALLPLAARYFLQGTAQGKPLDSVARIHLGNGARVERIDWLGDPSHRGLRQSAGLLVDDLNVFRDIEGPMRPSPTKRLQTRISKTSR